MRVSTGLQALLPTVAMNIVSKYFRIPLFAGVSLVLTRCGKYVQNLMNARELNQARVIHCRAVNQKRCRQGRLPGFPGMRSPGKVADTIHGTVIWV